MNTGEIWWSHMTQPRLFLRRVSDALLQKRSVTLLLPDKTPWRESMRELIADELDRGNAVKTVEFIQCPQEEPGPWLLEHYCRSDKRATYRPGIGYAAFLGESEDITLNQRILWLCDVSVSACARWMDFIAEYTAHAAKGRELAQFILEADDASAALPTRRGSDCFVADTMFHESDRYVFCMLLADHIREDIKPYLCDLIASLCADDIELCAACMRHGDMFLRDPFACIRQIIAQESRSDGRPFAFVFDDSVQRNAVWMSQLKFLFPRIERFRSHFVQKYARPLALSLPVQDAFGNIISHVQDLELGMLICIIGQGGLNVTTEEYHQLDLFRHARNELAHMNPITQEEVEQLLAVPL